MKWDNISVLFYTRCLQQYKAETVKLRIFEYETCLWNLYYFSAQAGRPTCLDTKQLNSTLYFVWYSSQGGAVQLGGDPSNLTICM